MFLLQSHKNKGTFMLKTTVFVRIAKQLTGKIFRKILRSLVLLFI